jgi:hypothetical protein
MQGMGSKVKRSKTSLKSNQKENEGILKHVSGK